jgi:hypothetical protein
MIADLQAMPASAAARPGRRPVHSLPTAVEAHLAALLDNLQTVAVQLWLVQPASPAGTSFAVTGLHGKMDARGTREAIMERIRHSTPTVGKPPSKTLQGTFPEVFKRAAALEPGEFFPLGPHEVRELLLWKAGGDFRRGRLEVNAEFERLDCVFRFDSEEGRYGVRRQRRIAGHPWHLRRRRRASSSA